MDATWTFTITDELVLFFSFAFPESVFYSIFLFDVIISFSSCWNGHWTTNQHQLRYTKSFDGNQLSLLGLQHPLAMTIHIIDSTSIQFRHIRLVSHGHNRLLPIKSITRAILEPFQSGFWVSFKAVSIPLWMSSMEFDVSIIHLSNWKLKKFPQYYESFLKMNLSFSNCKINNSIQVIV